MKIEDLSEFNAPWLTKDDINYLKMQIKPNECIDLGECDDSMDARKKATEILYKRYPELSKACIYDNMTFTDEEDYIAEYGNPTFIWWLNTKPDIVIFIKPKNKDDYDHSDNGLNPYLTE